MQASIQLAVPRRGRPIFRPLEEITLKPARGIITVTDAEGKCYASGSGEQGYAFFAGGALGHQTIRLLDAEDRVLDELHFRLEAETGITGNDRYADLLRLLKYSMTYGSEAATVCIDGRLYSFFVPWIRDHTHVLKGMKYFHSDLKSAIDLFHDSQREDGMIFDNIYKRDDLGYFEQVCKEHGFYRKSKDGQFEFRRMPIEADVEYLYVEGLYQTWKATGDEEWMAGRLDSAVKALEFSMRDPHRWSEKYELCSRLT